MSEEDQDLLDLALAFFKPLPESAPNPDNELTPEKIELGKLLYFDPRLSGDNNISCAFCHEPTKGWSDEEIEHALLVFGEHSEKHHILPPIIDPVVYWVVIVAIVASNIAAFFFMLPMVVIFDNIFSYFLVFILGLSIGLAFEVVINDFTHLEKHHQFFFSAIIPLVSVLIFLSLMYYLQRQFSVMDNPFRHPLYFSLSYAISFMLPYYIRKIPFKRKK